MGNFHYLGVFSPLFAPGGQFIILLGCQQRLEPGLFVLLQGNQPCLILFEGDVVLFEEVFGFLFVVLINGHHLLTLFGGIVDCHFATVAVTIATKMSALTKPTLSPPALTGTMIGPALLTAGSAM